MKKYFKHLGIFGFPAYITSCVCILGLACYPIIISPMMYPEEYRKIQEQNRQGFKKEDIQPGNMKIWTDPFGREKPDRRSS